MGAIADVSTNLAAVSVTGVNRAFTYPPETLNTADLPASFVMPPSSDYLPITTCSTEDDTITMRFVVAIQPFTQDAQSVNYTQLLTIADNLNAALKTSRATIGARVTWSISPQVELPIVVSGVNYWGVTATVTAQGF